MNDRYIDLEAEREDPLDLFDEFDADLHRALRLGRILVILIGCVICAIALAVWR